MYGNAVLADVCFEMIGEPMNADTSTELPSNFEAAMAATPHLRDSLIKLNSLPYFQGQLGREFPTLDMSEDAIRFRAGVEKQLTANPSLENTIVAYGADARTSADHKQIIWGLLTDSAPLSAVAGIGKAEPAAAVPTPVDQTVLPPVIAKALADTPHLRDVLIKLDNLPYFRGQLGSENFDTSEDAARFREGLEKQLTVTPGLESRILAYVANPETSADQKQLVRGLLTDPAPLKTVADQIEKNQQAMSATGPLVAAGPQSKDDPGNLAKIQQGLKDMGLYKGAVDGKMNSDTQAALQNLIVRAQMSDVYKSEHGNIEGIYGPKTQKAFEAMAAKGQMNPDLMNAIRDMNARGELRKAYTPQDVGATVAAIGKDPGLMAKIGDIKPPPASAHEITKLQQGLKAAGLIKDSPTGKLDDQTRQAMETLLVRAQMTAVYKATGSHIDGVYGKDTQKALDAMVAKGQISSALVGTIKELDNKGGLEDIYARGNVGATIAFIQKDPAAMTLINQVAPAATQAGPAQGPASVRTAAPV